MHQQPGDVDVGGGIRDPPLNGLSIRQLFTENLTLLDVLAHHGQRPARHAHSPGPDLEPAHGQALLHRRETLADLAQHLTVVQPQVLDAQLVGAQPAEHGDFPFDLEAGSVTIHDEGGDATTGTQRRVGDRHQDGEIGRRDAGHPDLATVDHPMVPVFHGPGAHGAGVAASVGFRDGNGGLGLALGVGLKVLLALLQAGHRVEHVQVRGVRWELKRRDGAGQALVDGQHHPRRQPRPADLWRGVERPQPELAAQIEQRLLLLLGQLERLPSGLAGQHHPFEGHQPLVHEPLDQFEQHLLLVGEHVDHLVAIPRLGPPPRRPCAIMPL